MHSESKVQLLSVAYDISKQAYLQRHWKYGTGSDLTDVASFQMFSSVPLNQYALADNLLSSNCI